jgi:hypothetical protein
MTSDHTPRFHLGPDPTSAEARDPLLCVVGDTLCRVRVWTEAEWEQIVPADRPSPAVHVPGLGWVGATVRLRS